LGVLGVRRDLALAVHVEREPDVAGLREPLRLLARVLVVAPPLVHHEDARALALRGVVPGEEALEDGVALLVLDGLRLHGGGGGQRERGEGERGSGPDLHVHSVDLLSSAPLCRARGRRATSLAVSWRRPVAEIRSVHSAAMTKIRRLSAPHSGGRNSPPETP